MLKLNLQLFAHKKGMGSTRNGRDSESKRLGAKRADGQLALLALENEQEYAIIKHCFEELKAKLAEQAAAEQAAQAAAQEGEPEA